MGLERLTSLHQFTKNLDVVFDNLQLLLIPLRELAAL
jgi:hypothetical protein